MRSAGNSIFFTLICLTISGGIDPLIAHPIQGVLSRTQYEQTIDETLTRVKGAERNYKETEKGLNTYFPSGTQRSPFYLSIQKEFGTYRESMKNIGEYTLSVKNDQKDYARLFSVGLLRSVDELKEGDEHWPEASELAKRMDDTIVKMDDEFDAVSQLYDGFSSFLSKMDEATGLLEKLTSATKQSAKDAAKAAGKSQNTIREFRALDTALVQFRAYTNGDSIRRLLYESVDAIEVANDSLSALRKSLQFLMEGQVRRGDEENTWELYESILEEHEDLMEDFRMSVASADELQELLNSSVELLDEFSQAIPKMDEGIASLSARQKESESEIELDRLRLTGLLEALPSSMSADGSPYRELKQAFENSDDIVSGGGRLLKETKEMQEQFIEHAGTMLGPEGPEYARFRQLRKEFDDTHERGEKQLDRVGDALAAFRNVIRENFLNTPQYWELEYGLEEIESRHGEVRVEENSGYIYDPNEYPIEPYHGKFISKFQLRLRKTRPTTSKNWSYHLILEGSNDLGIEGMILADSDSILYEVTVDRVETTEQTTSGDHAGFLWELPVEPSRLERLIESRRLLLRIHYLTITHRINLTMFRQKLFKEYEVPGERLLEWKRMVREQEKLPTS